MQRIRAYLRASLFPLKIFMEHRTDFLLNASMYVVPMYVKFFLFKTLYANNVTLGDYSLGRILTYFFATTLLYGSMPFYANYDITYHIKDGGLTLFLSKPISYEFFNLSVTVGKNLIDIPLLVLSSLFFLPFTYKNLFIPEVIHVILFFLLLFVGFLTAFYLGIIFNYMSFFIGNAYNAYSFYKLLIWVLSGNLLPLDILPLGKILSYNPFALTLYVPVRALTGKISPQFTLYHVLAGILWIFVLRLLQKVVFIKGLKRYEAYGG